MSVEANRFNMKRGKQTNIPLSRVSPKNLVTLPKCSPPTEPSTIVSEETVFLALEPISDLNQSGNPPIKRRHDPSDDKDLNNNISIVTEESERKKRQKLSEYKIVLPTYRTTEEPSVGPTADAAFQEYAKEEYNKALRFIQDEDLDDLTIETCYAHLNPF